MSFLCISRKFAGLVYNQQPFMVQLGVGVVLVTSFGRVPLFSSAQWSTSSFISPSQVQMFLRNNQEEGRNTTICGETMEESDEEEEDGEEDQSRGQMKEESDEEDGGGEEGQGKGDSEAAAVQQSSSAEQTECSGSSAALVSDPSTAHTAPPAGQHTSPEGADCSINGGHDGEQSLMFGFLHQRNVKTRDEPISIPGLSTLLIHVEYMLILRH